MVKHKYVRVKNDFIIFPCVIEHVSFKFLDPISAGFIYLNDEKEEAHCFGESISLGIKSDENDSILASIQFYKMYY